MSAGFLVRRRGRVSAAPPPPPPAEWDSALWLAVRGGAEAISGLVLLVDETDAVLRGLGHGGVIEEAGADLLFVAHQTGVTLPHDLIGWTADTGRTVAAVRVGSIPQAGRADIRLLAGREGADEADPAAAWAGYLGAWLGGAGADRRGGGRDLTAANVAAGSTWSWGGTYDGASSDMRIADAGWLAGHDALTVEAAVKAASTGANRALVLQGPQSVDDAAHGLVLRLGAIGFRGGGSNVVIANFLTTGGTARIESASGVHSTEPMHIVAQWRSGELPRLWLDGVETEPTWQGRIAGGVATPGGVCHGVTLTTEGPLSVGAGQLAPDIAWHGEIGLVTILPERQGAARIALEARNRLDPRRSHGRSQAVALPSGTVPVVAMPIEVAVAAEEVVDLDAAAAAVDLDGDTITLTAASDPQGAITGAAVEGGLLRLTAGAAAGAGSAAYTVSAGGHTAMRRAHARVTGSAAPPAEGEHWRADMYDVEAHAPASPRIVPVASQAQLTAALNGLQAGDRVRLQPGSYNGFAVVGRHGTSSNPIIVEAANPANKPQITGTIGVHGSSWIILHGLRTQGLSPAIAIGRNVSGEWQHDVHVARCELRLCGSQAITFDRRTTLTQVRNNRITTAARFDAINGLNRTLLAYDTRPGAADVSDPYYWACRTRIEHNQIVLEGTPNAVSGAQHGHVIYASSDRYQGNTPQAAIIAYNYIQAPRKYCLELKAGGWDIRGNRFRRVADAKGSNTAIYIRQASDAAPAGTGANAFRGNVYDDLDQVTFWGEGNGVGHYVNGDRFLVRSPCRIFAQAPAGNHGYRPANNMRLDHAQGVSCVVGFLFGGDTKTGNVSGVRLHNCTWSGGVTTPNATGTVQAGLTQLEPPFATHVLEEHEVGPGAFS